MPGCDGGLVDKRALHQSETQVLLQAPTEAVLEGMWPFEVPAWYLCPRRTILGEDPSVRDGVERAEAARQRQTACEFIAKVAHRLNLYQPRHGRPSRSLTDY